MNNSQYFIRVDSVGRYDERFQVQTMRPLHRGGYVVASFATRAEAEAFLLNTGRAV